MDASERVAAHVAAFNAAVDDGDWVTFVDRFAADARMSFPGLAVPDMVGRPAILAGYVDRPPDDTISSADVDPGDDADVVSIRWSRGNTGTMRIWWDGGLVSELEVTFD